MRKRKVVIIGASTGTDIYCWYENTIMNMKDYTGHTVPEDIREWKTVIGILEEGT